MTPRLLLGALACLNVLFCSTESLNLTGGWAGTASMVIDGVHKTTPLELELTHRGAEVRGTVLWGEHRREVTAASIAGPEIDIESATAENRFRLHGLFRNETLEGRFWIRYPMDPEPFTGTFIVERKR
jgi:hypothetical protein